MWPSNMGRIRVGSDHWNQHYLIRARRRGSTVPASPPLRLRLAAPALATGADAVHNAGRLALLVHALHGRDWSLLRPAMDDRLHQPARAALYPWLPAAIAAGYEEGALGVALAGAGPSVFGFCPAGRGHPVAIAIAAAAGIPGKPITTRIARL